MSRTHANSEGNSREKILVVKMSSLGDVVHALPAVSDLRRHKPDALIDWVVEEDFAFIPALHPDVARVIPVALRRWRRSPFSRRTRREFRDFRRLLQKESYTCIIDAQGLIKSALVAGLASGPVSGFDRQSAREPFAAAFYRTKVNVTTGQHAVARLQQLFARIGGYPYVRGSPDYGLRKDSMQSGPRRLLFAHGTTWPSKLWPLTYWKKLADLAVASGYEVVVPWWGEVEHLRAGEIAKSIAGVTVLPEMSLAALVEYMRTVDAVVAGDTGLGHIAAALEIPAIGLYGPTDPARTGNYGRYQESLVVSELACTPCFSKTCPLSADDIYPPCFRLADVQLVLRKLELLIDAHRLGRVV